MSGQFLRVTLLALLASSFTVVSATQAAYINELEHLLVDTGGYNDGGFKIPVTPCSFYIQGPQTSGRQTAGQWMRVAFHDFATADVAAGTGGMDGSIGFETNRAENSGAAMNDSLSVFAKFINKYTSMSDLIALGTVMASGACDGPIIPYSGGRVDATTAGAFGVPEPQGDLQTHLTRFAGAGFNTTEAIELTACGHTVGSVHQAGFPDIVQNAETPNNTNGAVHFDDTYTVFDNHVATGYLAGTTTNPLVVGFNVTTRSDFRLFNADKNATMKNLAHSASGFASTCTTVLTKMLNTVPRGVKLSPVNPIALKPVNIQLAVDASGAMVFSGAIRLLSSLGFPANSKRTVLISYKYRDGSSCTSSIQAVFDSATTQGSSFYGDTYYHVFSANIDPSRGISSYTVSVSEGQSRVSSQTATFTIEDTVFWLPASSSLSQDVHGNVIGTFAAAVLKASKPSNVSAMLSVPLPQIGAQNLLVTPFQIPLSAKSSLGNSGYTLYSSTPGAKIPGPTNITNAQQSTVDIIATVNGETIVDDFNKLSLLA